MACSATPVAATLQKLCRSTQRHSIAVRTAIADEDELEARHALGNVLPWQSLQIRTGEGRSGAVKEATGLLSRRVAAGGDGGAAGPA